MGSGIVARLILSLLSILLLQVLLMLSAETREHRLIIFLQSISTVFASANLLLNWYRFENKASVAAVQRLAAFFVTAVFRVVALTVFHSLPLYVIGIALETGIFSALMLFQYFRYGGQKLRFSGAVTRRLLKLSYPFIFSSLVAVIYGHADRIMLKGMLDSTAVALYSVSFTLAGAISILPSNIIEAFRPDIMDAKGKDEELYRLRIRQLYSCVFWICVCYCLVLTVFARPIILLLYGAKYEGSAASLSIVVWYTSFAFFGSINNMYMVAERCTLWVHVTALTGALVNVALNFLLIPPLGVLGAAWASLISQAIANFVMMAVIPDLRRGFGYMIDGILLRNGSISFLTPVAEKLKRKLKR